MKITEKQLAFLQDYITGKKRYVDSEARLELIDHLVSDFEENGNGNVSQFLASKSQFIFDYENNKQKAIHWAYQRELWRVFLGFFTNLKTIPIVLFSTVFLYFLIDVFSEKILMNVCAILYIIISIFTLAKTYHKKNKIKNLIEFKYLANLHSLPHVFFCGLILFKEFFLLHKWFLFGYGVFIIGLSFSALILVTQKRKRILKKYNYLLE